MRVRTKEEVKRLEERLLRRSKAELLRISNFIKYPISPYASKRQIIDSLVQHADFPRVWEILRGV